MSISATDITQILITLITTFGAIYCARIEKKKTEKKTPSQRTTPLLLIGMWICIAVAIINSGLLGWRLFNPHSKMEVAISYPTDQEMVEQSINVRGTYRNLKSDHVIWIMIYVYDAGRYYPQNDSAIIEANDRWSSMAFIGGSNDIGKKFDIIVLIADEKAKNDITQYLEDAKERYSWDGLLTLPKGAIIFDRITVQRK